MAASLSLADTFETRSSNPEEFRNYYGPHNDQFATMSDEEIRNLPTKLRNLAKSDHQLPGFFDILGRGVDYNITRASEEEAE